jgi:APA family basic amino acid/polyamine antiporter
MIAMPDESPPRAALARLLGLPEVTLSGIGMILGAGIYALIGVAAGSAGNALWLSFVISALVAFFTAMSYAELSSMFPNAGAEYEYADRALGRRMAVTVGILILFSGVAGAATVATGFAGYLAAIVPIPGYLAAIILIAVLSGLLLQGVRESAYVASAFTLVEVGGLLLIIAAGLPYLGKVDYMEMPAGFTGIFSAAALIFFAYQGFEEMVKFSEETRKPERTIPRALILALLVSTVLYMAVAVCSVSVVGWEVLSSSPAPFATVASAAWGGDAYLLLAVIALFATANTVLMMIYSASRITFGMARGGSLPPVFSEIHPGRRVPWAATLMVAGGAVLFLFAGDIAFIANICNFALFVTFVVINLSVILLRRRDPARVRPFTIPGRIGTLPIFPVLGLATSLFLMAQLEPAVLAVGAILTAIAIVVAIFRTEGAPPLRNPGPPSGGQ